MGKRPGTHLRSTILVLLLLLGAFLVVVTDTVSADSEGDYTYTLDADGATITGYTGAGGAVTIPDHLPAASTNDVVAIGDSAFNSTQGHLVTSVIIPNTVTAIGNLAFSHCASLTSVTIPDSVTSIGEYAFVACSSLTSVTIPNNVTSVRDYSFYSCSSLTSVTIPDSVTSIGWDAFAYCTSLTSVTIPDSVTSVGNYAFYSCSSLTSVTIGSGVTSIRNYTFYSCSSLTSVTIPDSVTSVGNYAFYSCFSLTSVTIGSGVTSIGGSAFRSCTSLTSITFLGLVAPTTVGAYWILHTPAGIGGHAYATSNFPTPGNYFPAGEGTPEVDRLMMSLGALHHFEMSGYPNPSILAGVAFTNPVIVTAFDEFGNVKTDYAGTVTWTSSSALNTLPDAYTFTAQSGVLIRDNGTHSFAGAGFILNSTGSKTITVTDASVSKISDPITVDPAATDHYHVISTTPQVAGVGWTGTATAQDEFHNVVTTDSTTMVTMTATGAAAFYTNGTYATPGVTYQLASGIATFFVKDNAAQTITLTATDLATKTGNIADVVVDPAAIDHYHVLSDLSQTAGVGWTGTATAQDAFHNVVATDSTTVVTMTNSGSALFYAIPYSGAGAASKAYTLSAGVATFSVNDTVAQTITLTATSAGSKTGSIGSIVINPVAIDHYHVVSATPQVAGVGWTGTATAKDEFDNTVTTDSTTMVTMTATGAAAFYTSGTYLTLGNTYQLASGIATFYVKDTVAQTITLTATDLATKTGNIAGIVVDPNVLHHFTVVGITDPVVAGVPTSPTVTAYDVHNNVNTIYTGTIHFTSNDANATSATILPCDYTFDGTTGTHTFINGVKLTDIHATYVMVTSTAEGAKTGSQTVTVTLAALHHFTVTGIADPVVAGVLTSPTVTACDAYNNVNLTYTGTIHFTSSDRGASTVLPANYTFLLTDNGMKNFADGVKLTTTGEQWVRATDTVVGTVWGEQTGIAVCTVSGAPALTSAIAGVNSAVLAWIAPTDNGSSPITGYKVYYGLVGPTTQFGGTLPATNLTASVTGLTDGTKYYFAVKAVNAAGDSLDSNIRNATVMSVPGTPTGLNAMAIYGQVTLTWTAPASTGGSPIIHYKVYRGLSAASVTYIGDSTSATFVDPTATAGSTFYYKVSAVNAVGEGAQSAAISVLVPAIFPVSGKIVDANGNGLAGITVALENGSSVKTDAQGNFTILASPGSHTLTISGPGIETKSVSVSVPSSGLVIGNITTSKASDYMPNILAAIVIAAVLVAVLVAVLLAVRKLSGKK